MYRIALAVVSMQLSTHYFFNSSASETRKQGLLRAYATAISLMSEVAEEDAKNSFIKYVPNVFCLMLNTAGMLLMKIICSSYARYMDTEGGKRYFNVVAGLLRRLRYRTMTSVVREQDHGAALDGPSFSHGAP